MFMLAVSCWSQPGVRPAASPWPADELVELEEARCARLGVARRSGRAGIVQSVAAAVGPEPRSRSPEALVSLTAPQVSAILRKRPARARRDAARDAADVAALSRCRGDAVAA